MKLVPYSFDGTQINDGTIYSAYVERANAPGAPGAEAQYTKRAGAWPVYTGKDFTPVSYTIKIECLGNFAEQWEDLNRLFFTGEETPKQFVIQDEDDSDKKYYVYATPTGQPTFGNDGAFYTVKLAFDETPIWQSSTQYSVGWNINTSTAATTLTIGGNADAYPVIEITPTSTPSTDYRYTKFVQVLPRSDYPWPNRPLDICGDTDATFDTAALVAAGKMQADGDDLRVFDRENEVDRWLSGMNSTDTRVWVNCNMPSKREMTLKTALDASSSTSIQIEDTKANREIMSNLPNTGRLIVDSALGSTDSEEFTYTQKLITGTRLAFVIGERAERNTTALAHSIGANVRYMQHAFTIVYGNASATAPDVDNTDKPIIDTVNSNNQSFVYTYFTDKEGQRTGSWQYSIFRGSAEWGRSSIFTTTDAPFGSSDETPATLKYPAATMGSNAQTYSKGGVWKGDSINIGWSNYFPDGISSLSSSGEKYQMQAAWPSYKARVSTDVNNSDGSASPAHALWSLAADVSTNYGTWQSWAKPSSDYTIPTGSRYITFLHNGSVPGGSSTNVAAVGVKKVTVGLTNPPHVHIRDEAALAHVDFTLYNLTTGESMAIKIPMLANKKLTIDTNPDCPTAKYAGEIVNGAVKLDTVRPEWFRLPPGDNVIGYETNLAVATDVTVTIKWRERMIYL